MAWSIDWDAVIGGLGLGLGGVEGYFNYKARKEQMEYLKQLQKQLFAREDNAVQRRVADFKAAGLSKTLAAGSAAGAGSVVDVSAPQSDTLSRMISGLSIARTKAEIDNLNSQTANNITRNEVYDAQAQKYLSDVAYNDARIILAGGQYEFLGYQQRQIDAWINKAVAETDNELLKQGLTRAQINKLNIENTTYADMLTSKLAGIVLDNQRKEMENNYTALFGTKMTTPTTVGKFFDSGKWSQTRFAKDANLSLGFTGSW